MDGLLAPICHINIVQDFIDALFDFSIRRIAGQAHFGGVIKGVFDRQVLVDNVELWDVAQLLPNEAFER